MALPSSTTPSRIRTIGASGQEAKLRTFHSPPMRKTAPRRPASLQFDLHLRASKLRGQDENAERSSILTVDRGTTPRLVPLFVPWVKHQEPGRSVLRESPAKVSNPSCECASRDPKVKTTLLHAQHLQDTTNTTDLTLNFGCCFSANEKHSMI